ncbi:MAG: 4-(cytidine 5'-diphospho)-2-C-methyl-D-erythritol kinase [Bacteroidota bacterium]|nr:4-(cytidine 5'-diphospho)-2-C-methyl-D-erythritol kinase [Bacteroidota bacterium]MDP4193565.1 4-(cytidine 5'-diphospho)-2-C-methyl-D-erythritol kinase [Bacteroidota bacterium]
MDYLEIKAPAKINFGLYITSKREDGYHNLETIFYPIYDLYDEMFFMPSDNFILTTDNEDLNNEDNLIIKAKDLLEDLTGKKINVKIDLKKNIPMGAGMGGGSSDAATTLISLNEMFDLKVDNPTLLRLALKLGSDVPFFIKPKPSFAQSRGEELSLIDFHISLPILIVNPGIHVSTKSAYQNIKPHKSEFNLRNLEHFDLTQSADLIKNVRNDFEDFVFTSFPQVKSIKDEMYKMGAIFSLMTGSGSTVFGIFKDLDAAEKARRCLPEEYFTFISY